MGESKDNIVNNFINFNFDIDNKVRVSDYGRCVFTVYMQSVKV